MDVVRNEIGNMRADFCVGIEAGNLPAGGLCLRSRGGRVGLVEEHLALQVALLDKIAIDKDEGTDSGTGKQDHRSGADGSAADDDNGGSGEALLSSFADGREEDLARVTLGIRSSNSDDAFHCV